MDPADTGKLGARWLDALLRYHESAPPLASVNETIDHFIKLAPTLLGNSATEDSATEDSATEDSATEDSAIGVCAIGVCVVRDGELEPLVVRHIPKEMRADPSMDPTRLFSGMSDEEIIPVDDARGGSTLHIASAERRLQPQEIIKARRLATSLGIHLQRARALEKQSPSSVMPEQVRSRLVQIEKLASMGQIVAGVVHELNNPLTSIIAYSDYLKKRTKRRQADGDDVDDDLERLSRIGEAAERILLFSRDLVSYARPAANVPGPVFLHEVVNKALVFCEHDFSKHGLAIENELPEYLPPVRGVPGQLTQVFINLFTNAVHAMRDSGGTLRITARTGENEVSINVADRGLGIAETDLGQIFEPFFTTKLEGRGTGLGLSIVKDIVTQHGGNVVATSAIGEGSTFCLYLPTVATPKSSDAG